MPELFLELLSEEMPCNAQADGASRLAAALTKRLQEAHIQISGVHHHATSVRLIVWMEEVAVRAVSFAKEVRGPREQAPQKAIDGFLRANVGSCVSVRPDARGIPYYHAHTVVSGAATQDLFPSMLVDTLTHFPWSRTMRWGLGDFTWIRPLRGIMCVYAGKPLQGRLPLGSETFVPFSGHTRGLRFGAPKLVRPTCFSDYRSQLQALGIEISPSERRRRILEQARRLAEEVGCTLLEDPGLLSEVAGLAEAPKVLRGSLDHKFLQLPSEILRAVLRVHQRCFSAPFKSADSLSKPALHEKSAQHVAQRAPSLSAAGQPESTQEESARLQHAACDVASRESGKWSRWFFLTVAEKTASSNTVISGTTRVLRARLSDAEYLWKQDRESRPEDLSAKLEFRRFHEGLGSMSERCGRLAGLASTIFAGLYPHTHNLQRDQTLAAQAGVLSKLDLATRTVAEFALLQGHIGGHLAHLWGEPEEVARAIAWQYRPKGPMDACPRRPLGVTLALADKIDGLCGFWMLGKKPAGSGDPFALRRSALGILRIAIENDLTDCDLRGFLRASLRLYETDRTHMPESYIRSGSACKSPLERACSELLTFFRERLRVLWRDADVPLAIVDAVLDSFWDVENVSDAGFLSGGTPGICFPALLNRRRLAVEKFLRNGGETFVQALRRASNIVRIEEARDDKSWSDVAPDAGLLREKTEKRLFAVLQETQKRVASAIIRRDDTEALSSLQAFCFPLDDFFARVSVNQAPTSELRANRLRLLASVALCPRAIADFSKLFGERFSSLA